MSNSIQAIRGMHDIPPAQTPLWQRLEKVVQDVVHAYGYQEIRLPIVEKTELFKRSIGEVTDIVEKEMYTFEDRNGDSLTLRPEGTAGCVRAGIENGLLYNQMQRFWYIGPMFRHERPQKGRYRQFHQIGVEAFGMSGPEIEAELILICARVWRELGLADLRLEINTLGSSEERAEFRKVLVEYLSAHESELDEDSKRRLHTNPLRILDSKNPHMQALITAAPKLMDHLGEASLSHFNRLRHVLDHVGIPYQVNHRLVRGLDYYSHTVFEWVTDKLGAQGTVCAGGRYDSLVTQLGGKETMACGFALGQERLVALMEEEKVPAVDLHPHVYWIMVGAQAEDTAMILAEDLRSRFPDLRIISNCGGGSMKAQMKRADRSQADLALILGEQELMQKSVSVKFLRGESRQETVSFHDLPAYLTRHIHAVEIIK